MNRIATPIMKAIPGLLPAFAAMLCGSEALAQKDTSKNQEFVISVNFDPYIKDAQKLEPKIPVDKQQGSLPLFSYKVDDIQFKGSKTTKILPPVAVRMKDSNALKPNYLYLGGGNFNSYRGGVYLANKANEKYSYFARYTHQSSNSSSTARDFADNELGFGGSRYFGKSEFGTRFNYLRNTVKFYGLDSATDLTQGQRKLMEDWNFGTWFHKKPQGKKMGFEGNLGMHQFVTNLKQTETELSLGGSAIAKQDKNELDIKAGLTYYKTQQLGNSRDRMFVDVDAMYKFPQDDYYLEAGVKATYFNNNLYVNPVIKALYELIPDAVTAYAGIDGGLKKQSLRGLNSINPFLGDSVALENPYTNWKGMAGLKGKISNNSEFNIEVGYEDMSKMQLFVNTRDSVVRFTAIYDHAAILYGMLGFQLSVGEKVRLFANGKLYSYDMSNEENAWQLPTAWARLGGSYNIGQKIIARLEVEGTNQRLARELGPTGRKNLPLDGFIDAHLSFDYKFSDTFFAWVRVNNLVNRAYPYWYQYPVYGFNAMGGLGLSF